MEEYLDKPSENSLFKYLQIFVISNGTAGLKRNIEKEDNKIIVTTIQN